MQFSPINREAIDRVRLTHEELKLPLVAGDALTKGLLSGKYTASTRFGIGDNRHRDPEFQGERFLSNLKVADGLKIVATRLGRAPVQIAIRWLMDTTGVAVVLAGAKTAEQVEENCQSSGWRLSDADYRFLQRLADEARLPLAG